MSREWLNEQRLRGAGLSKETTDQVLDGLDSGEVVRLYAGTDKNGQTEFYEIRDVLSDTGELDEKNVTVDYNNSYFDSRR